MVVYTEKCGAQAGCSMLPEALTTIDVYGFQVEVCFRVIDFLLLQQHDKDMCLRLHCPCCIVQLMSTSSFVHPVLSYYFKLVLTDFSDPLISNSVLPCACNPFLMLSALCIENACFLFCCPSRDLSMVQPSCLVA